MAMPCDPDLSNPYILGTYRTPAEAHAAADEFAAEHPRMGITVEVERDPRRWWQVLVWE